MRFSIVIPVYNRPQEVEELLGSISEQDFTDYEVVIIEDGSSLSCEKQIEMFAGKIPLKYFIIANGGPAKARNFGITKAKGQYILFLDSDCILPPTYLSIVDSKIKETAADAFGGPDKAHSSFSVTQKAINYSMTSVITTGGIRGSRKKMKSFQPRTFNMGVRRSVLNEINGFSDMRYGEDIDLSIRISEKGYQTLLFHDAWVYHKRRTNLKTFFKQVFNSGMARINLYKRHPKSLKIIHLLPAVFTLGLIFLLSISPFYHVALLPPILLCLIIFLDAAIKNRSLTIGALSIVSSYIQLTGYGLGFIVALKRLFRDSGEVQAFKRTFYD